MSTPAIILIVVIAVGLGVYAMEEGKQTRVSLGAYVVRNTLLVGLLYWGGFFAKVMP